MTDRDDTFELYDLRVEVVATDRPMVCGHRAGDWLEVRGENLTLPARPVLFDVRAGGAAAHPAGETAPHAPARLDDHRRRHRVPRSQLRRAVPHHPHRHAHVSPSRRDRRAAAAGMIGELPRVRLAPGYTISRLLKGGWQLAGGHGAVDRGRRARRHGSVRRRRHHDLRLRGHLHRGGSADRRVAEAACARAAAVGPCRCTPSTCPTSIGCRPTRAPTSRAASIARWRVSAWSCLDLVQLHWWDYDVPGYVEAAAWLDELRRAGKIRHRRTDQLRPTAPRRDRRGRHPDRLAPGAVFGARPTAGRRDGRTLRATAASACSATARSPAGFSPAVTWDAPLRRRRSKIDRW